MSWQAVEAVRECSKARGAQKSVLFALATYADKDGRHIFPAKEGTIEIDAGVERTTVHRAIVGAEKRKELRQVGRRGRCTEYSLAKLVNEWKVLQAATQIDGSVAECNTTLQNATQTRESVADCNTSEEEEISVAECNTSVAHCNGSVAECNGSVADCNTNQSLTVINRQQPPWLADRAADSKHLTQFQRLKDRLATT